MTSEAIEWAPFKTKRGINESTLMRLADNLQSDFLAKQKGYKSRTLARGKDGYVDIVWWASMADAEAAMKHVAGSPVCSAYFAAMDFDPADPNAMPLHFTVLREYGEAGK